jgi:hypothetical protein
MAPIITPATGTDVRATVICPASTFDRSRISLMRPSRCLPLACTRPT